MGKIESKIGHLAFGDKKVYDFLSDFTHFNQIIAIDKIESWEATPDTCSFDVAGIGKAGLKITQKDPNKLIKIISDDKTPIRLTMWIQLKSISQNDTRVKITIEPDVNMAIMMMVKTPLKEFANSLIDQMEKFNF